MNHDTIKSARGGRPVSEVNRLNRERGRERIQLLLTGTHDLVVATNAFGGCPWDSKMTATRNRWEGLIDQLDMEASFAQRSGRRRRAAELRDRVKRLLRDAS